MSTAPGTDPRPSQGTSSPKRSQSRWGTLVPLAIVVLGLLELTILVLIGVNTSLWWSVLIIVVGWIIGVALVVAAGQQSFVRLRSLVQAVRGRGDIKDHLSRPAFTLMSAVLFFFPGLVTDLLGIILLLTPVQRRSVQAMGLGDGSAGARRVLYRRTNSGVIDGEIVLEAEKPSSEGRTPPTLSQD